MGLTECIFSYPSIKTFNMGAQKNRLIEYMFRQRNKNDLFYLPTLICRPGYIKITLLGLIIAQVPINTH